MGDLEPFLDDPLAEVMHLQADLALVQRMAYGVVVTEADATAGRSVVLQALAILDPALSWVDEEA